VADRAAKSLMADAKLLNLAKVQANLARVPKAAEEALRRQLPKEVNDGLIPAIKNAMSAQYDTTDHDHQSLIDSVHSYENDDREISLRIIADAKDKDGEFIGSHVEAGHKARDGSHVAAQPAFYPTYRAFKPGMKRRLSKAARDAVKQSFEQGG
jgi:hypothetical protein